MWARVIEIITGILKSSLAGVEVMAYADAVVPTVDTVRVLRGSAPAWSLYAQQHGSDAIVIECWTCHDNPAIADQQLEALEERVIAALRSIPRAEPIISIHPMGTDPDGDLFRPSRGSRMSLNVNWRSLRH